MSSGPAMADALAVLEVLDEPDSRGRYRAVCPLCEQPGLELSPSSGSAVPNCPRCTQYFVNSAIKKLIKTNSNGHEDGRRHGPGKSSPSSPSPKKAAATEDPIEAMKVALLHDPETGNLDYLRLQARCVRAFDPVVGIFARQATYWHGRSTKLRDGWVFKKRDEWCEETGLTHRQLERARLVLREKGILEESRPSRRAPMHFRIDLEALKNALEAEE